MQLCLCYNQAQSGEAVGEEEEEERNNHGRREWLDYFCSACSGYQNVDEGSR